MTSGGHSACAVHIFDPTLRQAGAARFAAFRAELARRNDGKGWTLHEVALSGGGGPVAIVAHDKPGRQSPTIPCLAGHKGSALDFDFNPFHEHIVATASDDCTLKVCARSL